MARLILLRHAHPDGHDGRCVGHHDTQLSRHGRDSLEAARHRCVGSSCRVPSRIITSDLSRARSTAEAFAAAWQLGVEIDPRFREMCFGHWEGQTWDEINAHEAEVVRRWAEDWINLAPPAGESGLDFARRISGALAAILEEPSREPGEPGEPGATPDVVVVTHAGVIRVATTLLLDEPLTAAFQRSIDYLRAAIFDVEPSGARLAGWNSDISTM